MRYTNIVSAFLALPCGLVAAYPFLNFSNSVLNVQGNHSFPELPESEILDGSLFDHSAAEAIWSRSVEGKADSKEPKDKSSEYNGKMEFWFDDNCSADERSKISESWTEARGMTGYLYDWTPNRDHQLAFDHWMGQDSSSEQHTKNLKSIISNMYGFYFGQTRDPMNVTVYCNEGPPPEPGTGCNDDANALYHGGNSSQLHVTYCENFFYLPTITDVLSMVAVDGKFCYRQDILNLYLGSREEFTFRLVADIVLKLMAPELKPIDASPWDLFNAANRVGVNATMQMPANYYLTALQIAVQSIGVSGGPLIPSEMSALPPRNPTYVSCEPEVLRLPGAEEGIRLLTEWLTGAETLPGDCWGVVPPCMRLPGILDDVFPGMWWENPNVLRSGPRP